ncbi:winged helix-turn-helix transcriptional regulator [Planotetraspora mira]|uniref:HxlR family transcriptional regulator n=1 Tax=Planotetraspora mira TaxID=58121 RepID=A0A8J3TY08_9ACTN|nr:helix-turn-helix domain-containing protein [Planotetraspora mira]GII32549.1 HxlR family transcriptional regulator [Planotetraspora mira]
MEKSLPDVIGDICDPKESSVAFVRDLFGRLGEKWSMRALDELAHGPLRFTALMNALPGISHRILTVTLRTLEGDGMVSRTAYPETPPRVEYALTPLGESFLCRALSMVAWAQDHQQEIETNRAARR